MTINLTKDKCIILLSYFIIFLFIYCWATWRQHGQKAKNRLVSAVLFESRCLNVFPERERKHKLHQQTHYFCARPRGINAPLFTVMLTATRSKGTLFYRWLDKIVYAQFPSCGSIHNSWWRGVSRLTAAAQRDANANPRAPARRGSSVVIPLPLSARRQKGKKPFRSLRNLKSDLDLNVEGDLSIVMAFAEKLRAGLHSFVFGKQFHTSVQEKEVLVSF